MCSVAEMWEVWSDDDDSIENEGYTFGHITTPFLPDGRVNMRMYLFVDGSWIDITSYVRGDKNNVTITRGKANEATQFAPSKMTFKLNNPNGLFSNRNPRSIYFGKLGRNTPVYFTVGNDIRFYGSISSFPTKWDTTGKDIWCPMEATGTKQQLLQGKKPLKGPLRRAQLSTVPLALWPLNEGSTATEFANQVSGGAPMVITSGKPTIGSVDGPIGGDGKAVTIRTADAYLCELQGAVPIANTGAWSVECWVRATGPTVGQGATFLAWRTTGTTSRWELRTYATAATSGIEIWRDDAAGSYFLALASGVFNTTQNLFDGNWHYARVTANQVGSDTRVTLEYDGFTPIQFTDVGFTTGYVTEVVRASTIEWLITIATATIDIAQVMVNSAVTPSNYSAGNGYTGETTHARLSRLCAEQGVPLMLGGEPDTIHTLGAQTADTFLNLCTAAATAGQGLMYEPRGAPGLVYRSRDTLYNQSGPVLSYTVGKHLSNELVPTDDNQLLRNDVTITRVRGSEGRFTKIYGANNVNDPIADPDGAGLADEQPPALVAGDDLWLKHIAAWRVHQGTWDESRYPAVTVELHRAVYRSDDALTQQVIASDVGGYMSIIDPPIWLPPEPIELCVEGYTEVISNMTRTITFNCSPGGVWRVGVFDSPESRYEGGTEALPARLTVAVDASATSLSVDFTNGRRYVRSTDDAASLPFDIMIDGERITVGDVVGTTSPQTFTPVTRGVNGISKAHAVGAIVTLYRPTRYAL